MKPACPGPRLASLALLAFKRSIDGCCWHPLGFTTPSEDIGACMNPRCDADAVLRSLHLINGDIAVINVCMPCAIRIAHACGETIPESTRARLESRPRTSLHRPGASRQYTAPFARIAERKSLRVIRKSS